MGSDLQASGRISRPTALTVNPIERSSPQIHNAVWNMDAQDRLSHRAAACRYKRCDRIRGDAAGVLGVV